MTDISERDQKRNARKQTFGKIIANAGFLICLAGCVFGFMDLWLHQLSDAGSWLARIGPAFSTGKLQAKALLNPPGMYISPTYVKQLTQLPWWGSVGLLAFGGILVGWGKKLIRAGDDFYQAKSQYV
jgi:hypothetical protein